MWNVSPPYSWLEITLTAVAFLIVLCMIRAYRKN